MTESPSATRPKPTPQRPAPSQAEVERMNASIETWKNSRLAADPTSEQRPPTRTAADIDRLHRARIRREYVAAGLEPPEESPTKTLVSLQLLLEMGWTIEQQRDGAKVLVKPAGLPPLRRSLGI